MPRKGWDGLEFQLATFDTNTAVRDIGGTGKIQLRAQDKNTYIHYFPTNAGGETVYVVIALGKGSLAPSTITFLDGSGSVVGTDDGDGAFTGTGISSGTVDYTTGDISITTSVVGTAETTPTISYKTIRPAIGGEYRQGIVVLPTWTADGIVEMFSFCPLEEHVFEGGGLDALQLTKVEYQLSVDEGTTWLYWTGSPTNGRLVLII